MSKNRMWKSTIGRKTIMAISGILLMGFLIVHLGGNLTMFVSADLFNSYAHHLESLGPLLYVAEIGLLAIFLFHVVAAFSVWRENRHARTSRYAVQHTKGGPSKNTILSRSMIITGLALLIFIPLHIWMFKYNAGAAHPLTEVNGLEVKDLYLTVLLAFKNPLVVAFYTGVMLLLGFHLRHGFWSSLQSLGAMSAKCTPLIYTAGLVFALLLAGGFLLLPLYFFIFGEVPQAGIGGGL